MSRKKGDGRDVRLEVGGLKFSFELPSEESLMPLANWSSFSAFEVAIVRVLLAGTPLTQQQIADALDVAADGKLKNILPNLAGRGVIRNTPDGWVLDMQPSQKELVVTWLASKFPSKGGPPKSDPPRSPEG